MLEVYYNSGHDVEGSHVCIMEVFENIDSDIYYENIKNGYSQPFCDSCLNTLQELVPLAIHHGN